MVPYKEFFSPIKYGDGLLGFFLVQIEGTNKLIFLDISNKMCQNLQKKREFVTLYLVVQGHYAF